MNHWPFSRCKANVLIAGSMLLVSTHGTAVYAEMLPFEPIVGFAPKSITYDKPGGELDWWTKVLPCNVNRASVAVKFYRTNLDAKWGPVARLMLHSGSDMDQRKPHLWFAATIRGPWKNLKPVVYLEWDQLGADGKLHGGRSGSTPVDLSKPVQIQLSWTSEGETTMSFNGGPPIALQKNGSVTSIAALVSSAKFEFSDLKVGHAGKGGSSSSCIS